MRSANILLTADVFQFFITYINLFSVLHLSWTIKLTFLQYTKYVLTLIPYAYVSYPFVYDRSCCCCCSHLNSHNQVRGHRTGSSHSGAEEYPREKHTQPKVVHAYISHLTQFMPPPETYKSEIGSQSTICQVHTGAYVSLLAPGKTEYAACHPRKTTTYILHVVPTTTHTHDRRKSIGNNKQRTNTKKKERKEKRGKRKKKTKKERKEKKKQEKQEKARQEEEACKERKRKQM